MGDHGLLRDSYTFYFFLISYTYRKTNYQNLKVSVSPTHRLHGLPKIAQTSDYIGSSTYLLLKCVCRTDEFSSRTLEVSYLKYHPENT
jgi:hypothetical protein